METQRDNLLTSPGGQLEVITDQTPVDPAAMDDCCEGWACAKTESEPSPIRQTPYIFIRYETKSMRGCNAQYHKTFGYSEAVETRFIKPPKISLRDYREVDDIMASIRENGLLQPIIVRPVGTGYEVVAGARRLEACRRLRWSTIPCIIRNMSDKEAYEASLIENVQRKTMNPLEEAAAFDAYLKHSGWGGETALANRIGKSQEYISHRLSLLRLPQAVKQVIMRRQLSASIAEEIARLPDTELQLALSSIAVENHLTVAALRHAVASLGPDIQVKPRSREPRRAPRDLLNGVSVAASDRSFSDPDFLAPVPKDDRRNLSESEQMDTAALILKLAMIRLANLVDGTPENSRAKEILVDERNRLHERIDTLIKLRLKMSRDSAPQILRA